MERAPFRAGISRLGTLALSDLGLRARRPAPSADPPAPSEPPEPPVTVEAEAPPAPPELRPLVDAPPELRPLVDAPAFELPPGVVWLGSARRRPELQRFVDHLGRQQAATSRRTSEMTTADRAAVHRSN